MFPFRKHVSIIVIPRDKSEEFSVATAMALRAKFSTLLGGRSVMVLPGGGSNDCWTIIYNTRLNPAVYIIRLIERLMKKGS
jgi:hypothetical protein